MLPNYFCALRLCQLIRQITLCELKARIIDLDSSSSLVRNTEHHPKELYMKLSKEALIRESTVVILAILIGAFLGSCPVLVLITGGEIFDVRPFTLAQQQDYLAKATYYLHHDTQWITRSGIAGVVYVVFCTIKPKNRLRWLVFLVKVISLGFALALPFSWIITEEYSKRVPSFYSQ
jgi:hypothetical protein